MDTLLLDDDDTLILGFVKTQQSVKLSLHLPNDNNLASNLLSIAMHCSLLKLTSSSLLVLLLVALSHALSMRLAI